MATLCVEGVVGVLERPDEFVKSRVNLREVVEEIVLDALSTCLDVDFDEQAQELLIVGLRGDSLFSEASCFLKAPLREKILDVAVELCHEDKGSKKNKS